MIRSTSFRRIGAACALVIILVGCAQQQIKDTATKEMRAGNYEAAIEGLQEGTAKYPENAMLRSGLTSAKAEAMARLVTEATQHRIAGRFDDADKVVARGLNIDPGNERLLALRSDMILYRKQSKRLEEVNQLISEGKKEQALQLVEAALKESPRQPDFTLLQRRLETELRLDGELNGRRTLAETRPISLDFRNAPISAVLEAITRGSGINFILDRDVRQDSRVTVYLRSAKVEDAIELVTGAHQLARRIIDPRTVLIYPNTPEKQKEHQEQVIRVFHLGNADAKATSALLRSMLRIKDPYVDERANLVAIREAPEIVALAERLVALHDLGDAEVMLEVEILEVKTTRLTELGISFPSSVTLTPLAAAGSSTLTLGSLNSLGPDRVGVNIGNLIINLRREVGDYNILANPRIRAKNREKARIMIGDKVPVITTTATSTGFVSESISYLDVGLKLEVEPTVSPDEEITIKLGLEVSTLTKEVKTSSGSLAYQLGTRNAATSLRLRDGETQLLGGLISNDDRSTSNRVPGLGDLPIAGRLFSSQKDDAQRTELVLAITPRILRLAPRPELTQAEMWVGTEMATRLRQAPGRGVPIASAAPTASASQAASPPKEGVAPTTAAAAPQQPSAAAEPATPSAPNIVALNPVQLSWKAPAEAKVGETFSVALLVASKSPLRGAPFELSYPHDLLDIVEVVEGSFFKTPEGSTNFTHSINSAKGRMSVGILRSDAAGSSGENAILSVKFKARAAGAGALRLVNFRPISPQGMVTIDELPIVNITIK